MKRKFLLVAALEMDLKVLMAVECGFWTLTLLSVKGN
ncbi:hypothetical protein MED297_21092 [Reinekea sp. MED297]|uniref:Uncharacterized protein n=1 Tax=Reinekea blandensis MED297 TaxID=314283 RepID=A4B9X3_9GAMM|nr:hypothetical protein MED297_21092 [Reinekea sp. MED297] [Reinekea blandensis MED297]